MLTLTKNRSKQFEKRAAVQDHGGFNSAEKSRREQAVAAIQALRQNRKTPVATTEEIIAWRDEGRK